MGHDIYAFRSDPKLAESENGSICVTPDDITCVGPLHRRHTLFRPPPMTTARILSSWYWPLGQRNLYYASARIMASVGGRAPGLANR